jgi:hypothetical protein
MILQKKFFEVMGIQCKPLKLSETNFMDVCFSCTVSGAQKQLYKSIQLNVKPGAASSVFMHNSKDPGVRTAV